MKKQKTTVETYKSLNNKKKALYVAKWGLPFIPALTIVGINFEEWFLTAKPSVPFGFISLIVSILLSILSIYKQDEDIDRKASGIYQVALTIAMLGATFLLLGDLINTMGIMFLFTALGCVGSATSDQFIKSKLQPKIDYYKQLIDENLLDKNAVEKELAKQKAEQEAKQVVKIKIKDSE